MKTKRNLNAVHWVNDDEIATEFYEVTPLSHKRIALLICVTSRLILGDVMWVKTGLQGEDME